MIKKPLNSAKKEEAPMPLNDIWYLFQKIVFPIQSTEILFNQYKDSDPIVDLPNANNIRKQNLRNYLESFFQRPPILVVGEAPGPRGCRFSGVPFTSEAQLCAHGYLPFAGRQSSARESPYAENTATIFWKALAPYHPKFFVWNCVPFHPHNQEEILSIRSPTKREVSFYSGILLELKTLVKPIHILAVGRKAEFGLKQIGVRPIYLKHPSHGGAREFRTRLARVLARMKWQSEGSG